MMIRNEALTPQAPGEIAACKIGLGNYLLRLLLEVTGTAVDISTHVEWVLLQLNEKDITPKLTGAELEAMNAEMGMTTDNAMLALNFIDPFALNAGSMYVGGIDTAAGVSSLVLQVKFAATAPADMRITVRRDEVPPFRNADGSLRGLQEFKAWSRAVVVSPAADLYTLTPQVGPSRDEKVLRLFCFEPSANLDYIGVRKNGLQVHDDVPVASNDRDLKDYGLVPQTNLRLVDFVKRGDNGESVDKRSATSLEYRFKTTGTGNITVIEEKITRIDVI